MYPFENNWSGKIKIKTLQIAIEFLDEQPGIGIKFWYCLQVDLVEYCGLDGWLASVVLSTILYSVGGKFVYKEY